MLTDGEFQSEQIGSFFSFAKASDEFGVSLIGEARIPKRSTQMCETILRMYEAGTLTFSFEIMASVMSERDGVMVIDAAEGNELIGMAIVSVPAYPEATALQLVAERQEDHEMDETVKKLAETEARLKLAETEARLKLAEEKMMDDEEKLRQKDDALEETVEKQKQQEAELAAAQEKIAEKDARIAELEAQVSQLEPFKAEAEKLKAEKEAAELAAKQQELTAFAEVQGMDVKAENVASAIAELDYAALIAEANKVRKNEVKPTVAAYALTSGLTVKGEYGDLLEKA